ncbi:hypothetical protein NECAME_05237 [Necator americanus]|uniref:Piezo TM1-24 domain-containing protein n=1 Tax=Necator americanus TaxID=51031 RepID=W2SIP4_NECAM|nr:hypothetical protein NECAME_05237 [Necator americanus]ETN69524.1 hypothetical protein NECAME_05237 [Necator americanus]
MVAIISFALYHAYTFALLSMMVWALLYHSIFGLILLVFSCTLWMFKDSRGASFAVAPTVTIYVEVAYFEHCQFRTSERDNEEFGP